MIKLTPKPNYKYLRISDNTVCSGEVCLGIHDKIENYKLITDAEAAAILGEEPKDTALTVSQYAWIELAKALCDYSGETAPLYIPTITVSPAISSSLDTLTINGISVKEYITNKGWTIAEV